MAHLRVPRSVRGDLVFRLKDRPGGALIDDYDWTNGSTHAQFPTVVILNSDNDDVTADWAVDIAGDTLPSGSIKDPTTTTGVWRLMKGHYRIKVQPSPSLPFGNYTMRVTFDTSPTTAKEEDHEVALIDAGDVEFGDLVFGVIVWDDLVAIVKSSITDPAQQETILAEMASSVEGDLQACGIDTAALEDVPKELRTLLLTYGRLLILTYDGSAGLVVSEVAEGPDRVRFASGSRPDAGSFSSQYERRLTAYCHRNSPGRQRTIGTICREVGHEVQGPDYWSNA